MALDVTSWACYGCYAFMVNGELPWDSPHRSRVIRDSVATLPPYSPGRVHGVDGCGHDHGDDHDEMTECESKAFIRRRCDCCGTLLGGFRFAFTVDA